MKLGERIKAAREARGKSQDDLAKVLKMTQPGVNKIEHSDAEKSKHTFDIAKYLNCSYQWLADETGEMFLGAVQEKSQGYIVQEASILREALTMIYKVAEEVDFEATYDEIIDAAEDAFGMFLDPNHKNPDENYVTGYLKARHSR